MPRTSEKEVLKGIGSHLSLLCYWFLHVATFILPSPELSVAEDCQPAIQHSKRDRSKRKICMCPEM